MDDITARAIDSGRIGQRRVVPGPKSKAIFDREAEAMAPGLQSIALFSQIAMDHAQGCTLVDVDGNAPDLTVTVDNRSVPLKVNSARAKVAGRAAPPPKVGASSVQSPMPGKVVKVLVAVLSWNVPALTTTLPVKEPAFAPVSATVPALAAPMVSDELPLIWPASVSVLPEVSSASVKALLRVTLPVNELLLL